MSATYTEEPCKEALENIHDNYLNNLVPNTVVNLILKDDLISDNDLNKLYNYLKNKYSEHEWIIFDYENINKTILLFHNANIIIGTCNSPLVNEIFTYKNANVIELINNNNPNFKHWHICEALSINYKYISVEITLNKLILTTDIIDNIDTLVYNIYDKLNPFSYNKKINII
jgi:hypothetical protein